MADLVRDNLSGSSAAVERRDALGRILGIGYGNGKQLVSRLNHYGITRADYEKALVLIEKESE